MDVPGEASGPHRGLRGHADIRFERGDYSTPAKDGSRTWRYGDIDNISSSGPFELTVTTFERDKYTLGDRKAFNFQLKERITETAYNAIWIQIQQKNGKIQLTPAERGGH